MEPKKPEHAVTKVYRNLNIRDLTNYASWQIETKEDLQKYMDALYEKIESNMADNTVINVEF